jgi:hypothetical protein
MVTKKITITLPEESLDQAKRLADRAGLPLSTWITKVVEHKARIEAGLDAIREWEAEHGEFTEEELAWADSQIAAADAQLHAESG